MENQAGFFTYQVLFVYRILWTEFTLFLPYL